MGSEMCIRDRFYILDVVREKLSFPNLMKAVIEQNNKHHPQNIIVEDAASGQSLIAALRHEHYLPIKAERPQGDKYIRLSSVTGLIESGYVYLPHDAPWLDEFLLEVTRFPNSRHDDQVDALSQALAYAREVNGYLSFYDNL